MSTAWAVAVAVPAYAAVSAACVALNVGIMWYERNIPEVKRTLINRLITNKCLLLMLLGVLVFSYATVLFSVGVLPEGVCDTVHLFIQFIGLSIGINVNVNIFLRYLYVCRFKNLGVLDELFCVRFYSIVSVALPLYLAAIMWVGGFYKSSLWSRCSGVRDKVNLNLRMFIIGVLVFTIVLHAVCYILIMRHKRRTAKSTKVTPVLTPWFVKNSYTNITKKSFVNLDTTVVMMTLVLGIQVVVAMLLPLVFDDEARAIVRPSCACFLVSVVLPSVYLWRNREMRSKITGMYTKTFTGKKKAAVVVIVSEIRGGRRFSLCLLDVSFAENSNYSHYEQ